MDKRIKAGLITFGLIVIFAGIQFGAQINPAWTIIVLFTSLGLMVVFVIYRMVLDYL